MGIFEQAIKKKGYKPGSKQIDAILKKKNKPAIKDMAEWEQLQVELKKSIKSQETLTRILKVAAKFGVQLAKTII